MKTLFLSVLATAAFVSASAFADVVVKDAWVRATPGAAKVSAGYAVIANTGAVDDILLDVRAPDAGMTQLHSSTAADGVMRMDGVKELALPSGKEFALKPGGYHLMIMDLKKPLKVGEEIPLIFSFKKQGPVKVTARVLPLSASGFEGHQHHK